MKEYDFKCEMCGLALEQGELPGDLLLCPVCGGRLEEGSFVVKESEDTKKSKASSGRESFYEQKPQYYNFKCLSCSAVIRIPKPLRVCQFRCGKCSSKYQADLLSNSDDHFVIVPIELSNFRQQQEQPPQQKIVVPEIVKSALKVFGLSELIGRDELTKIFRKCVSEYHPDKVSHLGADLKKLAEAKTREYISAFDVIKVFSEKHNSTNWNVDSKGKP